MRRLQRPAILRRRAISLLLTAMAAAWGSTPLLADEPARAPTSGERDGSPGLASYQRHCARCHGAEGGGVAGLYPSLRDDSDLWRSRQTAIRTVLAGRTGEITMDGARFASVMPTHGFLGNEIVAETLSYVQSAWGPGGEPFSTDEVARVRGELLAGHPHAGEFLPGVSPLAEMGAVQYVTSEGPPVSVADFDRARSLYYGHCTGCHGVLRQGTAGNPLTPEVMRERGTEYLKSVIAFGSSTGMPGWGSTEALDGEDIHRLALFLQHPVPQPPEMDEYQIRDSWQQHRIPAERPAAPAHSYDLDRLFVVTLHDPGEVALIDGASRRLIARVPVGGAPHRVTASASGRYLYVICRDGTVSLIDLYAAVPERVASVRVGYEARAVGASRFPGSEDRFAMAGAYWPPQLVLLDGGTLEPLQRISTRSYTSGSEGYHPEPRVTDVVGSPAHPEFISSIKETGHVYLVPFDRPDRLQIRDLTTARELRAGSFSTDGRYYLTPTDSNAVSVLDVQDQRIAAEIPARVFGGNQGTAFVHPQLGPVWVTSTMVGNELVVIGTDPAAHPEQAWTVVDRVAGPASGSLFLATHPASPHLWLDTPLNADSEISGSVSVFRTDALDAGYRSLPVAGWSGLEDGPRRVLQPTYDAAGGEVWLVVWNPQNLGSAVVVVDDSTLTPRHVIRDAGLITATRIYSVAALRQAAGQHVAARPAAAEPADTPAEPAGAEAATPRYSGAELYASNCANCHGTYGEGDGIVMPSLSVVLKDLRYLSARNDGRFPGDFVRAIIDGRATRAAHGPEGMPVWGAEFARSEGYDGAAEQRVKAKIDALEDFLRSMQVPPRN
jgi:nitrite reductase (NO-forming) / hydroxylamine reductase